MTHGYVGVPKSPVERFFELIQSLRVIADALELLRSPGKSHQILPIAGQLRALLTDKATDPLLLSLARSMNQPLRLFVEPGVAERRGPQEPNPDLILSIGGIRATRYPFGEADVALDLVEYLDLPVLSFREAAYSVRDIIEVMANRAGGAHFAPDLPRDLGDLMRQVGLGGFPAPSTILAQLADITLDIGRDLVRRIGEAEVHFALALRPESQEGPKQIFEAQLPGTAGSVSAVVDPIHRVRVSLRGLDGSELGLPTMRRIDWSRPHHFAITASLTDTFGTTLELVVDGEVATAIDAPFPLIVQPGIDAYDVRLNDGPRQTGAGLRFGLAQLAILPSRRSVEKRGETFGHYRQYCADPAQQFVWLDPAMKATRLAGTTDHQGDFRLEAYSDAVQRWEELEGENEAG